LYKVADIYGVPDITKYNENFIVIPTRLKQECNGVIVYVNNYYYIILTTLLFMYLTKIDHGGHNILD